ncbi:MAG: virulence RhuM family protein, partial [Bacteroidales bacterium]|nr:virulence RhuM family protein [Bacteroidales bacterium]
YYCLDMILSVGYRVKSQKGIQFRIWSNRVLKEYLLRGYAMNRHIEQVEKFMIETRQHITESKVRFDLLTQYIEDVLSDYNDINQDTRMQLELIHEALAELQVRKKEPDTPRRLIGFKRSAE